MTRKGEFNPFRKTPENGDREIVPRLQIYFDEFLRQARNNIAFGNPHVPKDLKDSVLKTIEMVDLEVMAKTIGDNPHNLYAGQPVRSQFTTWMQLELINRELGSIKELVFQNEQLDGGVKMAFSNLLTDIESLLDQS